MGHSTVISVLTYTLNLQGPTDKHPGGGGTQYIKKVGMLVENFEIDP